MKFCPLTNKECLSAFCALWTKNNQCAIASIADTLVDIDSGIDKVETELSYIHNALRK
jgi:hypothetical protein